MENLRFVGTRAFNSEENFIFFGRENIAERMFQNLLIENTAVIYGNAGTGKTSLINAGITPILKNSGRFELIPLSAKNFPQAQSLYTQLEQIINSRFSEPTYIDKLIGTKKHIWYYLKKIQAISNKIIVFLIDDFDQLDKGESQKFHSELYYALKAEIPEEFISKINSKKSELSAKGLELLNSPVDMKMIWSAMPQSEDELNSFAAQYHFNPKNNTYLKYFSQNEAKEILKKTASFKSIYKAQNNFDTSPFDINDKLLTKIFAQKHPDYVPPLEIQLIGQQIEKSLKNTGVNEANEDLRITQTSAIHYFYAKNIQSNLNEKYYEFMEYISRAPENAEIPISMIPDYFCVTFADFIHPVCNSENNSCNIFFKSQLLKEELVELLQKDKLNINKTAGKDFLNNKKQNSQYQKRVLWSYRIASLLLMLLVAFGFYFMNKARKKAQDNKQLALSNMYAAYSYKNAESDPTLSFRYAQKAYEQYPENHEAYSALLNAYYNTEVFYSLKGELPPNSREAVISPDGKYILTITENTKPNQAKAVIYSIDGKEINSFVHDNPVYFTGFSKDSEKALFADSKGTLFRYNIKSQKLQNIQADKSRILHSEVALDKYILILSEKALKLFDEKGQIATNFPIYDFAYDMACIAEDGTKIVAGAGNNIYIFSSEGNMEENFKLPLAAGIKYPRITAMQISKNKEKILIVVNDMLTKTGQLILCNNKGEAVMKFGGHTDWIRSACFSPNETHIVTASYDKTAAVLNQNGTLTGILKGHKSLVSNTIFFENDETVLSVGDDATIRQWKFGRLINPLAEIQNIDEALFSPSGLKILTVADTMLQIHNIFGKPEVSFDTKGQKVKIAKFEAKEKYIYALTKNKKLHFWQPDGTLVQSLDNIPENSKYIDFYSDSAYVLYPADDFTMIVRNLKTGAIVRKIKSETKVNYACFVQSNGKILSSHKSGFIHLRRADGKTLFKFNGHTGAVKKAILSPDETQIVSIANDKTAMLWSNTGKLKRIFPSYGAVLSDVSFSPDGNFIVMASNNKIRLYTTEGQFTGMISYPGKTKKVVFSSDGDYIITMYSNYGKNIAKLQHISPKIILRYVNEDKVFGNIQEFDLE